MKISLTNNEYELSKFIFVNYLQKNFQYQLINNKQISQISNSLINILSDYDYLVFQEDNPPRELEAFLRSSIELLLEKGVTEENISTLRKELEIVMKELGVPRIKDYQVPNTTVETEQIQLIANSEEQQIDHQKNNQFATKKDFKILEELGRNSLAGRITFKAKDNRTAEIVIIKKFQFLSNSWDGYKLIEKEIETLSKLNHPNIPKYLGQYEDEQGVCLVQQYIDAPSLASFGQLPIAEVTQIALSVLSLLVYLQELSPPVFHRDIKPENILYNRESQKVYLVDFGLAKTGVGTTTSSTINGGTLGFIPPEQLLGKKLDRSSDLYSLGLTLICLLGGISSGQISQFLDHRFEIDFSKAIPSDINWKFRDYLRQLVSPDHSKRFKNAELAQQALSYLRNIEFSLFISENHQKLGKVSFSDVWFKRKNLFYVSIVTIGTIGVAYYLFYPFEDLIITSPENPNVDLVAFKDRLLNLINITGTIAIVLSTFSIISRASQEEGLDHSKLALPISIALSLSIAKTIIEVFF